MAKHIYVNGVKNSLGIDCFEPGKTICRGCLTTDQNLENAKPLEVFFRHLTGICISDSDGIPHWFCSKCADELREYAKFRQKMIDSHNMVSKFLFEGVMLEKEINDILEEINESDITINANVGNIKIIEKQIANASTTEDVINMAGNIENKVIEQGHITHTVGNEQDIDMPDISDFINEEIKELINKNPAENIELLMVTNDENLGIKENAILSGKEDNDLQSNIWNGCQVQVANILQEEPIEISAVELNHNEIMVPEEASIQNNSEIENTYPSLGGVEFVALDNTNTENVVPVHIIEECNGTCDGDISVVQTKSPNVDHLSSIEFFEFPPNLVGSPSTFSYEASMSDIVDFVTPTTTMNDIPTKTIEIPVCTGISVNSAANEIELQMSEDTYTTLKTVLDEIELEKYVQNIPENNNSDDTVLNKNKLFKEIDRNNINKNTLIANECDAVIEYIQESSADITKNNKKSQFNSVSKVRSKSKNTSIHKLFKSKNNTRPQFTNKVLKKSDELHKCAISNQNVLKTSQEVYKIGTKNSNVLKKSDELYKSGTKFNSVLKKSDELHKIGIKQSNTLKKSAEERTFETNNNNVISKSDLVHKIGTNNNKLLKKSTEKHTFRTKNINILRKSDVVHKIGNSVLRKSDGSHKIGTNNNNVLKKSNNELIFGTKNSNYLKKSIELHESGTRSDKASKVSEKAQENSSKIMLLLKNMTGCTCKKFRCPEKFTEERKKAIFHEFWALSNIMDRRSYILGHIKWRYISSVQTGKSHGYKQATDFFFELDANNTTLITRVCQEFFLNTLGIPMTFVETALRQSNAIEALKDKIAQQNLGLLYD